MEEVASFDQSLSEHTTILPAFVELQSLKQWCCFRLEKRNEADDKPTKVPYHPSGYRASSKKSTTWSTHEAVIRACKAINSFSGIGFFFNGKCYSGIDLDDCVDENGVIAPWAMNIIRLLDSYAELSTSGTGVHIIVKGLLPDKIVDAEGMEYIKGWKNNPSIDGVPKGKLELYSERRFFVFTGNHVAGTPTTINARQDELLSVLKTFFVEPKEQKQRDFYKQSPKLPENYQPTEIPRDDHKLWQIIFREKSNGSRWERLYYGDTGDYLEDESAADFALASKLVFYTQHDASRVERMMWQTGLAREKWTSHPTYLRQLTISNAMQSASGNYDPRYSSHKHGREIEELEKDLMDMRTASTNHNSDQEDQYYKQSIKARPVSIKLISECLNEMQYGDGNLFRACFQGQAVYDTIEHEWYFWNKHHWIRDVDGFIKTLVSGHLGSVYLKAGGDLNIERARLTQELALLSGTANEKGETSFYTDELAKDDSPEQKQLKSKVQTIDKQMKQFQARCKDLRKSGYKNAVLDFATSVCAMPRGRDESSLWDSKKRLLGVKNGIVDLNTGTFREGQPEDYIRTISPTEWKGLEAECPLFMKFLQDLFALRKDRDEIIRFLQRLIGYALTGTCDEALFVILCGEKGRNGKSTLFKILTAVLGKALVGDIQKELLLDSGRTAQANGAKPDVLALQGKRLAIAAETKKGDKLNISAIKQYTGGDELSGRPIHGKHFVRFEPTHTLFLHTNYKPHADAGDEAFWARACLINFEMRFIEEPDPNNPNECKYDPSLAGRIIETELAGVLAWIVRGALDYHKIGLKKPESVKLDSQQYRTDEDTLQTFINENCKVGDNYIIQSSTFIAAYNEWSEGSYKISSKELKKQMIAKGFKHDHTKSGWFYSGISLLGPEEKPIRTDIGDGKTTMVTDGDGKKNTRHRSPEAGLDTIGDGSDGKITKVPRENAFFLEEIDFSKTPVTPVTSYSKKAFETATEAELQSGDGKIFPVTDENLLSQRFDESQQTNNGDDAVALPPDFVEDEVLLCSSCLDKNKETRAYYEYEEVMYCQECYYALNQ